eukprot:SAG31_NODE_259_length_18917_cov_28.559677_8_plen_114_part_00
MIRRSDLFLRKRNYKIYKSPGQCILVGVSASQLEHTGLNYDIGEISKELMNKGYVFNRAEGRFRDPIYMTYWGGCSAQQLSTPPQQPWTTKGGEVRNSRPPRPLNNAYTLMRQ